MSVAATIPSATLGSGEYGEFILTLSAAQADDLVVGFTLKGSAVNGTDYAPLKTTKKIKAGQISKAIRVTPLGDLGGAQSKVVKLTLSKGSGYTINPHSAGQGNDSAHALKRTRRPRSAKRQAATFATIAPVSVSTSIVATPSRRKMGLLPLLAATYFMVSGGPYGSGRNHRRRWLRLGSDHPLCHPVLLEPADCPDDRRTGRRHPRGGWFSTPGCAAPWGRSGVFQEAWLSLAASVFDMAIYPTLFVTYLEHFKDWGPTLTVGHRELFIELAVVIIATLWNLRERFPWATARS